MKKKIALFANGCNFDNLYNFERTLFDFLPRDQYDVFSFLWNASYAFNNHNDSTGVIFDLPDLSTFDAAVIYNPGQNLAERIDSLYGNVAKSGIPAISIGMSYPGFYYVENDNYEGMIALVNHLIEKHNVKRAIYIAGAVDNDDSIVRGQAIKDAMHAHGLILEDDDIFYAEWQTSIAANFVEKLCKSGEKLPDAFICANDYLAEMVSYVLYENGIHIPNDCIVTGFDYLEEGQVFYPSIASVDQIHESVGKATADILEKVFEGKEAPKETVFSCEFRPGGSCGCGFCRDDESIRRKFSSSILMKQRNQTAIAESLYEMRSALIEATNYEDMVQRLKDVYFSEKGGAGDSFYLMYDPSVAFFAEKNVENYPKYEYTDVFDVAVGIHNRKAVKTKTITRKELIPEYDPEEKGHVYSFLPIYYRTFVCGYIVYVDRIELLQSRTFIDVEDGFSKTLELYRRNVQLMVLNDILTDLTEKDPLTSVKNRTAFNRQIERLETSFAIEQRAAMNLAVVFFDINNLKKINDELGHEEGDRYIRNACKLICETFENSLVYRVGGDEFVTILSTRDNKNHDKLLKSFVKKMDYIKEKGEELPPTERISIAYGYAMFDEKIDRDVKSLLNRADELMYQKKHEMKNGDVR